MIPSDHFDQILEVSQRLGPLGWTNDVIPWLTTRRSDGVKLPVNIMHPMSQPDQLYAAYVLESDMMDRGAIEVVKVTTWGLTTVQWAWCSTDNPTEFIEGTSASARGILDAYLKAWMDFDKTVKALMDEE